jgi:hypothetical protein
MIVNKVVRTIGTNDEPWFCGRDVCDILEYNNYRKAIRVHVDGEYRISHKDCSKNTPNSVVPIMGTTELCSKNTHECSKNTLISGVGDSPTPEKCVKNTHECSENIHNSVVIVC